jgi:translation initiation factor 1A
MSTQPKKGGKTKHLKRGGRVEKAPCPFASEENMMYGKIIKNLGALQMNVLCNDNVERRAKIRGTMKSRVWLYPGDIVLLSLREYDSKNKECDILGKYKPAQIAKLKAENALNFTADIKEEDDCGIRFGDQDECTDEEDGFDPLSGDLNEDEIVVTNIKAIKGINEVGNNGKIKKKISQHQDKKNDDFDFNIDDI